MLCAKIASNELDDVAKTSLHAVCCRLDMVLVLALNLHRTASAWCGDGDLVAVDELSLQLEGGSAHL